MPQGALVALLGTNGAGKTTTLRAISGFIGIDDAEVTEGAIATRASASRTEPPHRVTARGIVLVPERSKVFENLSVAENLRGRGGRGQPRRSVAGAERSTSSSPRSRALRAREAGCSPAASGRCSRSARRSSARRSCCSSTSSRGLAPLLVEDLDGAPAGASRDLGMTVLLVEQNARVALDVADYGYVMENGRVVLDGTPERLRAHQDIREFYLGGGGRPPQLPRRQAVPPQPPLVWLSSALGRASRSRSAACRCSTTCRSPRGAASCSR